MVNALIPWSIRQSGLKYLIYEACHLVSGGSFSRLRNLIMFDEDD